LRGEKDCRKHVREKRDEFGFVSFLVKSTLAEQAKARREERRKVRHKKKNFSGLQGISSGVCYEGKREVSCGARKL